MGHRRGLLDRVAGRGGVGVGRRRLGTGGRRGWKSRVWKHFHENWIHLALLMGTNGTVRKLMGIYNKWVLVALAWLENPTEGFPSTASGKSK